jgi:hypothetical protein
MKRNTQNWQPEGVVRPRPRLDVRATVWLNLRKVANLAGIGIGLAGAVQWYNQTQAGATRPYALEIPAIMGRNSGLYLIERVPGSHADKQAFEDSVRAKAHFHGFDPNWLMACMWSESRFDHQIENMKGSGATGLIQFMPFVAKELGITVAKLKAMTAIDQLEYVERYLARMIDRYGVPATPGRFYLLILYPKASNKDDGYVLYKRPSKAYTQNAGLDTDRDGRVTVADVEARHRRLFPELY